MSESKDILSVRDTESGICFSVRVQPRASRNEWCGIQAGALRLRLTSPPVEGEANSHCINLLASLLQVHRRDISIIAGETSRLKTVKVTGLTRSRLFALIDSLTTQGHPPE